MLPKNITIFSCTKHEHFLCIENNSKISEKMFCEKELHFDLLGMH